MYNIPRSSTNLLHSCGFFGNLATAKDFSSFLMPYAMESALLSTKGVLCEVMISEPDFLNPSQQVKRPIRVRRRAFDVALMQDRGAAKSTINTMGHNAYLSCEMCLVRSVNIEGTFISYTLI